MEQLPKILCGLPTFRPVALKMLKVLSREIENFSEVTRLLESDPSFAAEVLAVANSSLYAGYSRIGSPARAIVVLGIERVKSLTMALAMRAFLRDLPQRDEIQRIWSHSRACALVAEELAAKFGITPGHANTCGLMHDLGRFGLMAGAPREYAELLVEVQEGAEEFLEIERQNFGFDHCRAGELLIKTWRLPPEFAAAAASHHQAVTEGPEGSGGIPLIRAACQLAYALGFPSIEYKRQREPGEIVAGLPGRPHDLNRLEATLKEKFYSLDLN